MGKTTVLTGPTLAWARERFARYYATAVVPVPSDLSAREFAAFPFTEEVQMRRHAAFRTPEDLRRFLPREAPRHVYYSSAYYEDPGNASMPAKGWLGADLVFDLDADHLRQSAGRSYAEQLALAKEKTIALYDDFLVGDFGVDPSEAQLVFSGGRGYHIHVRSDGFRTLTSPERREIVDYVLGVGVDPKRVLRESLSAPEGGALVLTDDPPSEEGPRRRGRRRAAPARALPPLDAPGWAGRIARSLDRTLERWEGLGPEGTEAELRSWGVARPEARRLTRQLLDEGRAAAIRSGRTLDVFKGEPPGTLLDVILARTTIEVQGETDAPVTTDIHRLIRLPGSLHGGSGLRVVPLPRERLDAFDPLRDAEPFVGNGRTAVVLSETVDHPFPEPVRGAAGDRLELPDARALFLILRGEAELPDGPGR